VIPVSDKIENLHDWLLLPLEMRRNSAGAAVVLGEIAASHADLLAACEAVLDWVRPQSGDSDEQCEVYDQVRAAIARARGA
jgi:hypothetical protein